VLPTHSIGIKIQTSVKIHEGANRDLTCSRSSSCGQQQEQVVGVVAGTRTSGAWSLEDDTSSRACDKSSSSMALTAIPAPRMPLPLATVAHRCRRACPCSTALICGSGWASWRWCGQGWLAGNGEQGGPNGTGVANHTSPATLPKGAEGQSGGR
jgi:hypothetical protein